MDILKQQEHGHGIIWITTSLVCHGIFHIALIVLKHLMIIKKRINIFLQQNMWKMIINYMTY